MPLIIAATDFSSIADNAVNYSCNLALTQGAKVVIIHSYVFPVMFSDIPLPAAMIDDTQKDAEEKMNLLVGNMRYLYPSLDITGVVVYGTLIDAIHGYVDENVAPWVVVIGNGDTEEQNAWFESSLRDASKHMIYPVLAVPPQAIYKPVLKICLAYDNNPDGNEIAVRQLREIAIRLNAELHIFNAAADVLNRDNVTEINGNTKNMLAIANPRFHFEYEVSNVDEAILAFNEKNAIDWLAIIPRKHSFFEGLFHRSHTKAIARHSPVPLLMLHESTPVH
jgi:nucleotide-binding universal stress UspA family protein